MPKFGGCNLGAKDAHWLDVISRSCDVSQPKPRGGEQGWINPADSMIIELYVEVREDVEHARHRCEFKIHLNSLIFKLHGQ